MADSMEPCKMLWTDPCCRGNELAIALRSSRLPACCLYCIYLTLYLTSCGLTGEPVAPLGPRLNGLVHKKLALVCDSLSCLPVPLRASALLCPSTTVFDPNCPSVLPPCENKYFLLPRFLRLYHTQLNVRQ